MRTFARQLLVISLVLTSSVVVAAPGAVTPDAAARAQAMLAEAVHFRSSTAGGETLAFAQYLADALRAGGFAAGDVGVHQVGNVPALVARYRGTGRKRPIIIGAHMDVVEALAIPGGRDPFTMTADETFLYARGVSDNKFDLVAIVQTLLRLKAERFRPSRDLILALSGDEETDMTSGRWLAQQFPDAEFMLNGDAGGGTLAPDWSPVAFNLQAAEKTYADFRIRFTNPGGHSSRPRPDNAIYSLGKALANLSAHQFPVSSNVLTRAFFREAGPLVGGELGAAMRRFSADPTDPIATARLSAEPEYVGQVRTTCVATMLTGGHAVNALPQSASVTVNCRIFPGTTVAEVRATLTELAGDPDAEVTVLGSPVASDASPLRPDVMAALRKAIDARFPGLPIVPRMDVGATDSMFFRNAGIPSYGVSSVFMRPSDNFAHGLNERLPIVAIEGGLQQWYTLLTELSR
jgi:carboxypeptidase PM20D1